MKGFSNTNTSTITNISRGQKYKCKRGEIQVYQVLEHVVLNVINDNISDLAVIINMVGIKHLILAEVEVEKWAELTCS